METKLVGKLSRDHRKYSPSEDAAIVFSTIRLTPPLPYRDPDRDRLPSRLGWVGPPLSIRILLHPLRTIPGTHLRARPLREGLAAFDDSFSLVLLDVGLPDAPFGGGMILEAPRSHGSLIPAIVRGDRKARWKTFARTPRDVPGKRRNPLFHRSGAA